jgi:1,4-dihydroxy-2-naphthoyl-CoA hydrolase
VPTREPAERGVSSLGRGSIETGSRATDSAEPASIDTASIDTTGFASFLEALGAKIDSISAERATLTMPVTPALHQPNGIVHGGIYCTIVETLASLGAAVWLGDRGHVVGVANHTDFLRATRTGTLYAVSTPIHRGRTQQLWLVEITDAEAGTNGARLVARGEVRLANIASTEHLGGGA